MQMISHGQIMVMLVGMGFRGMQVLCWHMVCTQMDI